MSGRVEEHRIRARAAQPASPPAIDRDPAVVSSFLSDAAHVPGGFAAGVATPRTEAEVAALVAAADRILPVGAQSSLTGGATPRGDVVLSTRALTAIGPPDGRAVRVGAGVPLATLQRALATRGLYYPPVPTYDGAFVGGTIATNAAGAATFKYGSTRSWVEAMTVVLANGDVLDLHRGDVTASPEGWFEVVFTSGHTARVPVPSYRMPDVSKLSAGYFARPGMDLVDLFVGSEGTLGVVVDAVLRLVARPRVLVALVTCAGDAQAIAVTGALRASAMARRGESAGLDVSAIEYMDDRALRAVPDDAFARANGHRPAPGSALLLVQLEVSADEEPDVERLQALLASESITREPVVVAPGDDRGAERLFGLREAVPAGVNARVAAAKAAVHPAIEKTAADPVVPFPRMAESIALYRAAFERRGLDYAIWGHASDGNLHPNLIPRSLEDVERGREAILEIARGVIAMGGAPLAEHGVGRSALKQRLLGELYGAGGIEQMRAVKRALDPAGKLAPGVLFPP
ncbi:MAG: FAD-binding oxidoreductase [Acidobacteria bacterium]|nr:FAD-binding oxidoreductase [Acidobacteriota bacterium]